MTYPQEFSPAARARIEAERLKGRRELEQAKGEKPPDHRTNNPDQKALDQEQSRYDGFWDYIFNHLF